ncbi:hypothetical protein [Campylobacter helveticus]|uniref:DUF1640 domain-containing protein n=1 Tax=Campylobacter helveticus TaxID=28898 RepID=A0AAX2UHF2_9BACT|nr:hypothetical protein [Campylobacter helveticus]MCR2062851.1 hypothetical protein [Campylobacter helveticus]MCR2067277.1 hypothetical protein [Campylobacter helveticus]TNB56593.1 hypothetical protein FDW42_07170 [Campylobacter helveticus]TNB57551.1 hypothetical protein FDW44_06870 [Campylobacter helveticus]TNB62882.1 hypothetical protein FDW43_05770 [Campylobacter helveticus]
MEQMVKKLSLNQSARVLIENFVNKHFEGGNKQELINEAVQIAEALVNDVGKDNALSVNELKDEAIDKIKSELATKDFVDRRIAETELKIEKRFSKIETYMVAIIILIVILQPRVFDFLTSIFK